jgi:hypothetical protein
MLCVYNKWSLRKDLGERDIACLKVLSKHLVDSGGERSMKIPASRLYMKIYDDWT